MAKYINREELVEWLKRIPLKDLSDGLGLCRVIMEEDFKRAIRTIPAGTIIDVAPVVHGRWIGAPLCGNDNCKCSECGSWHNIHANLRGEIMQKYCPNCGAKMDGGSENAVD